MGLAQQIAFSSLLAFFPAMILLVGLLGLVGAYDALGRVPRVVAPGAVTDAIEIAQESASGRETSASLAFVLGLLRRALGGERRDELAGQGGQPRLRPARDPPVLEGADRSRSCSSSSPASCWPGMFVLIVFGGPIGTAIAEQGRASASEFELVWTLVRWPLAFVALLLFFALVYYLAPNLEHRNWKWITPGLARRRILWLALSGLFALYTSFSDSYDRTYGTLAGGIVLLLWLYYCRCRCSSAPS